MSFLRPVRSMNSSIHRQSAALSSMEINVQQTMQRDNCYRPVWFIEREKKSIMWKKSHRSDDEIWHCHLHFLHRRHFWVQWNMPRKNELIRNCDPSDSFLLNRPNGDWRIDLQSNEGAAQLMHKRDRGGDASSDLKMLRLRASWRTTSILFGFGVSECVRTNRIL